MQKMRIVKYVGCCGLLGLLLWCCFIYLRDAIEYAEPPVEVERLILEPEDLLPVWKGGRYPHHTYEHLGQMDDIYIAFDCKLAATPPLQQTVYVFSSSRLAASAFEEGEQGLTRGSHHWRPAAQLSYESPMADQFAVYCGYAISSWVCEARAQYAQYYSVVSVGFDPKCMTWQQFEDILWIIDGKMAVIDQQ